MQIQVAKRDLLKLAPRAAGIAERKSTMPSLSNVLLRADGDRLHLAATDLYLALFGSVPADVGKPGSFAVRAKDLVDRIKNLPDGPIDISVKDNVLVLKAKGSARRYTMHGMDGGDFPPLPQVQEGSSTLTIEVASLQRLIAQTFFSIADDETRAHLNSLLVEWDGDIVRAVSTDGHRLSKVEVKLEGRSAAATLLIPKRALREIQNIAEDLSSKPAEEGKPSTITITQSGPTAFFSGVDATFSVKLVDAQFPPYAQVIPKEQPKSLRAPRVQLMEAIRAVSVAASDRTGGIRLAISKGKILLTSESPDAGDGSDEVACEYAGSNMSLGCRASYLTDVLGAIGSDEVELGLAGELDPVVVKPVGVSGYRESPATDDVVFVVMPMRI